MKQAFHRVLRGDSFSGIARDLGFTTATALRSTLRSRWWIGEKARTKKRIERTWKDDDRLSAGKLVNHEQPIIVKTNLAAKPLVSVDVWERVQEMMNWGHRTWTQRKTHLNEFLGAGLLYCHCGGRMYHKKETGAGRQPYYVCANRHNPEHPCSSPRVKTERIDRAIGICATAYLAHPEFVEVKITEAMSAEKTQDRLREIQTAEKAITTLGRKKKNILDAIEGIGYTAELGQRLKALEMEIAEAKHKVSIGKDGATSHGDPKELAAKITNTFIRFQDWATPQQKAALAEHVARITVTNSGSIDFMVRTGYPVAKWQGIYGYFEKAASAKIASPSRKRCRRLVIPGLGSSQ